MDRLNYHHLRYFREVALDGNLTRTSQRLNLSQSALSMQIRKLEDRLGHPLFDRVGRVLELTEVGVMALEYANRIFATGEEFLATIKRDRDSMAPLRVGALSTLSRNFQLQFLRPILKSEYVDIVLRSGNSSGLLLALQELDLDVVLTTEPPISNSDIDYINERIAEQSVAIHGHPHRLEGKGLDELLNSQPLILPTESAIRSDIEALMHRLGVKPRIAAEVDDMAMVRLLTREDVGIAFAPSVVLADEIASGMLKPAPFDLEIVERFYAVTIRRQFPNLALSSLLADLRTAEAR
jgi:LysR family transcriptional activator of nhaA